MSEVAALRAIEMVEWQRRTAMMTKLQEIVERIEQLPPSMQSEATDRIAEMLAELEDQAWEDAFADPASDTFFASAEAEIAQARADGSLIPLFPTIEQTE
jgi:hypothetical protein